MLLKGFFNTIPFNPYPYWNGTTLFESSTPGVHYYTFTKKVICKAICVGAGAGGFSAKLAITVNKGSPSEATLSRLVAMSGGSGAYNLYNPRIFFPGETLKITIPAGGTGYSSTAITGEIYESNPSYEPTMVEPTGSVTVRDADTNQLYFSAAPATCGKFYLSTPSDPNSSVLIPSKGGIHVSTEGSNGHDGTIDGSNTDVSLNGASSVYGGYGVGGNAGYSGNNQTGTPFAGNGGSGYVKIYVVAPD